MRPRLFTAEIGLGYVGRVYYVAASMSPRLFTAEIYATIVLRIAYQIALQ